MESKIGENINPVINDLTIDNKLPSVAAPTTIPTPPAPISIPKEGLEDIIENLEITPKNIEIQNQIPVETMIKSAVVTGGITYFNISGYSIPRITIYYSFIFVLIIVLYYYYFYYRNRNNKNKVKST